MKPTLTFGDMKVGDTLCGFGQKWLITRVKRQGDQVTLTTTFDGQEKQRQYFHRDKILLWRVERGEG
jgi:hypothetical protein